MFKVGQAVVCANKWHFSDAWFVRWVSTVERLTPKQGFLGNGAKFWIETGFLFGQRFSGKIYPLTEPGLAEAVEKWQAQQAEAKKLSDAKYRVSLLIDRIQRGYFDGFTADQLNGVADEIESMISEAMDNA